MGKALMALAAFCGAWLLIGVSLAIGCAPPGGVLSGQLSTSHATQTLQFKSSVAFYAKATGQVMTQTIIGPPTMVQRWLKNHWLDRGRSSPTSTRPVTTDTITSLGLFPALKDDATSLERAFGRDAPITGTYETKVTGGSHSETIPRGSVLSGTSSSHDIGGTVLLQ